MSAGAGGRGEETGPSAGTTSYDPEELPPVVGILSRVLAVVCVVLLVGILATILLQVVMRYGLNNPLTWTDEVTRLQLVWLTFLGAVLAYRFGADIAVDALHQLAESRGWQGVAGASVILVQVVIVLVAAAFVVGGLELVQATADRTTPALGLPVAASYAAVPVCGLLILVSAAERLVQQARRTRRAGS